MGSSRLPVLPPLPLKYGRPTGRAINGCIGLSSLIIAIGTSIAYSVANFTITDYIIVWGVALFTLPWYIFKRPLNEFQYQGYSRLGTALSLITAIVLGCTLGIFFPLPESAPLPLLAVIALLFSLVAIVVRLGYAIFFLALKHRTSKSNKEALNELRNSRPLPPPTPGYVAEKGGTDKDYIDSLSDVPESDLQTEEKKFVEAYRRYLRKLSKLPDDLLTKSEKKEIKTWL
ncbi:MAG: hypothetical protein ACP5OR_02630 [Candidatus Dormibacteria bacterium]